MFGIPRKGIDKSSNCNNTPKKTKTKIEDTVLFGAQVISGKCIAEIPQLQAHSTEVEEKKKDLTGKNLKR